MNKRTVIVMDQAPIHTSYTMQDKRQEWAERHLEIFELPSYSPELNLIEILCALSSMNGLMSRRM